MTTTAPGDDFGHNTLTHMVRTLVNVVPDTLTTGQRAGLINALNQARIELPELYSSCDLDVLAKKLDPKSTQHPYRDQP